MGDEDHDYSDRPYLVNTYQAKIPSVVDAWSQPPTKKRKTRKRKMNPNPNYIPDEEEERALINAGVPVGPIAVYRETGAQRRLREFLAKESQIQAALIPPVALRDQIREIVKEELQALDAARKAPRKGKGRSKKG